MTDAGRPAAETVTVVVIAYNDAEHLPAAVRSALAQGDVVGEVVVVDDRSTDATAEVADALAATNPRVRVLHREQNSGGCGTPRNDGTDAARGAWIAYLDSDDVLPDGAVRALLTAARAHDADVAAGLCVRLELPGERRLPWLPELYAEPAFHERLGGFPEIVHDTLCVNKLYRRSFLKDNDVRFPDGGAHYEDFVFTGRLYAAAPRLAVVPDTVYIWNQRRAAPSLSISQRRDRITNWEDRLGAHRTAVEAMEATGQHTLALAAQAKFVHYDIPMYVRELAQRTPEYRERWWEVTRDYVAGFPPEALAASAPADRWMAAVLTGRDSPADAGLTRLAGLSAVPPRLAPPYSGTDEAPVWDAKTPPVPLDGIAPARAEALPLCVTAHLPAGRRVAVRLELAEMYGRLAPACPETVEVRLRHRTRGHVVARTATWAAGTAGGWHAEVAFGRADVQDSGAMTAWDVWAVVTFAAGATAEVKVRAGAGLRRRVLYGAAGVLLLSPYATHDASLALRVAGGTAGLREVVGARLASRRRAGARR